MTGPGDERAAAHGWGRGELRASHADREQAIEVLKDAFAEGRLDNGGLDARVGQALASRTYAELAAVTADIPAGPAAAPPPRQPARAQNRAPGTHTVRNAAIGSGVGLIFAAAAVLGALDSGAAVPLLILAAFIVIVVVPGVMVAAVATSRQQRRSRGQLPPRPGQGGQAPEGQRPGQVGHDPALPRDRPDQIRADVQTDSSRPGRPRSSRLVARAPRSMRPVPGAV